MRSPFNNGKQGLISGSSSSSTLKSAHQRRGQNPNLGTNGSRSSSVDEIGGFNISGGAAAKTITAQGKYIHPSRSNNATKRP